MNPSPLSRLWRTALVGLLAPALLVSCGRESVAPAGEGVAQVRRGMFSIEPVFPRLTGGKSLADVVEFERVRVVLHRADGTVALDTTVLFPVGADSVVLQPSVTLSALAGSGGENFKLDLGYINAAGNVVFQGGPVDLTVVPKGSGNTPAPVQIPVRYSGPGASATKVVVSPRTASVNEGQTFNFGAVATDASGTVIPNTPIVWAALDPARAVLESDLAGSGHALGVRGTARIAAQLLTGPADTVTVTVSLLPKALAMVSGDAQKGAVSTKLTQPIAVKVTASDGIGVAGVNVSFAAVTGGGSMGSATVPTDASGVASTTWTLGATAGTQTATASVAGLSGSPVTFSATARSVAPVRLVFTTAPAATNAAGSILPISISALDAQGDVATTFNGAVSLSFADGANSAPLLGTVSVNAVNGVATFADVRINRTGTGYVLRATASSVTGANSSPFAITAGPAVKLEFGSYPVFGSVAGPLDAVTVIARDAAGNTATTFTGAVSLSLVASSSGGTLGGPANVRAVDGVATFDGLTLVTAGEYQLGASSTSLTAAKGPSFPVTAGPAARLVLLSGGGQQGSAGAALAKPIIIGLADRYSNPTTTPVTTVTFSASAGGFASPSSGSTDASGTRSTTWTLGGTAGTQTLTASASGLGTVQATASAVAAGGATAGGDIVVIDDVNAFDDNYGLSKSGSSYVYGNAQFIRNLVNFNTSGARAAANKTLLLADRGNSDYTLAGYNWTNFGALLVSLGLPWRQTASHADVNPVASDVKLLIIHTPATYFSYSEINSLKQFAAEGGRILFIGENSAYYSGQALETSFLHSMGASSSFTVVPACAAWGEVVRSVANPLTSGYPATGTGGFYQICSSYHTGHGATETPIMYDASNLVVGTVVQVNTTPLPPAEMAALRSLRAMRSPQAPAKPSSTSGDLTVGPPRKP